MSKKNPSVLWTVDQHGDDGIGKDGRLQAQKNIGIDNGLVTTVSEHNFVTGMKRNSSTNDLEYNTAQPRLSDLVIDTSKKNYSVGTNSDTGVVELQSLYAADPSTSGNTADFQFISGIKQATNGLITPTKHTIPNASTSQKGVVQLNDNIDSESPTEAATANAVKTAYDLANGKQDPITFDGTYNASSNKAATVSTVTNAINELDATKTSTDGTNVQVKVTEENGKITAVNVTTDNTANKIHSHGKITSDGTITDSGVAIQDTDTLVIVDKTNNLVRQTSIAFDGSTATKALTQKGTWETFTNYSHPDGDAASKTGVPIADVAPGFGGTFKVNQITTDSTSHVSAVTERTITIPNTTGTAFTAGLTKLYTGTGTNTDGTMTQNAIKTALDGKQNTINIDASAGDRLKVLNQTGDWTYSDGELYKYFDSDTSFKLCSFEKTEGGSPSPVTVQFAIRTGDYGAIGWIVYKNGLRLFIMPSGSASSLAGRTTAFYAIENGSYIDILCTTRQYTAVYVKQVFCNASESVDFSHTWDEATIPSGATELAKEVVATLADLNGLTVKVLADTNVATQQSAVVSLEGASFVKSSSSTTITPEGVGTSGTLSGNVVGASGAVYVADDPSAPSGNYVAVTPNGVYCNGNAVLSGTATAAGSATNDALGQPISSYVKAISYIQGNLGYVQGDGTPHLFSTAANIVADGGASTGAALYTRSSFAYNASGADVSSAAHTQIYMDLASTEYFDKFTVVGHAQVRSDYQNWGIFTRGGPMSGSNDDHSYVENGSKLVRVLVSFDVKVVAGTLDGTGIDMSSTYHAFIVGLMCSASGTPTTAFTQSSCKAVASTVVLGRPLSQAYNGTVELILTRAKLNEGLPNQVLLGFKPDTVWLGDQGNIAKIWYYISLRYVHVIWE